MSIGMSSGSNSGVRDYRWSLHSCGIISGISPLYILCAGKLLWRPVKLCTYVALLQG